MKLAHKESILSYLITIRNSFRQKSFPAVQSNLEIFNDQMDWHSSKNLYEFGVGYTLTDAIYFKTRYNLKSVELTDLNNLLSPRAYAFASLINASNYRSKVFRLNSNLLLKTLLFGWDALKQDNIVFSVVNSINVDYKPNSLIFSNAVLEHIDYKSLNHLFKNISEKSDVTLFGIIDTNDHLNRFAPIEDHFKHFDGSDLSIQIRGNNMTIADWRKLLLMYFDNVKINIHRDSGLDVSGVLYFTAKNGV